MDDNMAENMEDVNNQYVLPSPVPVVWDSNYNDEHDADIYILNDSFRRFASLDPHIWGKIYIMNRENIIGKIYVHSIDLTIDDSNVSYNSEYGRLGLNSKGIDQIDDVRAQNILDNFKQGINISIDDSRNIYVNSLGCPNVFSRGQKEGSDICAPEGINLRYVEIEADPVKIFDMKRFKEEVKYKLLALTGNRIGAEEAYEVARLAIGELLFEPPIPNVRFKAEYTLRMAIINIAAMKIFGDGEEFEEIFSSVNDSEKYNDLLNIWRSMDFTKMQKK